MVGITSYGLWIPKYRLQSQTLSDAWNKPAGKGERAISNHDEDSLTMAVNSVFNCFDHSDSKQANSLYFASTTSSYREKQSAALIATVIDLPTHAHTIDFSNSLRAGTSALISAFNNAKVNSGNSTLVVASDSRLAVPGSDQERILGDSAATVMLGSSNVIAEIEDYHTIFDETSYFWRRDEDKYIKWGDIRFSHNYAYAKNMAACVKSLMQRNNFKPQDFSKVGLSSPDPKSYIRLGKSMGFDPKTQFVDALIDTVGMTGTPHPLLMLIAALEESNPGDKILLASFGDGADALVFKVTDNISNLKGRQTLKTAIESSRQLLSYAKFLSFRNLIKQQHPASNPFTSQSMMYREKDQFLKLHGKKCRGCGNIHALGLRVCSHCKTKDDFDEIQLSRTGKIFSYEHEYYYPSPDPPVTMAVVDLDSGGRILLQVTDTDHEEIEIGMNVELTFRKFHEGGEFHNYYWKCRKAE